MRRIQVIAATDSWDRNTGKLVQYIATDHRLMADAMIAWIGRAPTALGLGKAYKKRTTGDYSQNHHFFGHLHQLVTNPTSPLCGNDIKALSLYLRDEALSWGWNYHVIKGKRFPYEEEEGNSYEYGKLLDCTHHFADNLPFILYEGEEDDERELKAFLGDG